MCGSDTVLIDMVRNYVDWERRMDGFLSEPLTPADLWTARLRQVKCCKDDSGLSAKIAGRDGRCCYEALDGNFDRRIALKCGKAGFRKRLPPEVRNASDISHPNVCKTFEIHTASTVHGDVDFLTMEFLEGDARNVSVAIH